MRTREEQIEKIIEAMEDYTLLHTYGDDGHGYPLVDALTPDGKTIDAGKAECGELAAELYDSVIAPYILDAERRAEQRARAEIGRAANDVISERNRQSEVEGFSADRDDLYTDFQLSRAASVYAQIAGYSDAARNAQAYIGHSQWPWDYSWLKPTTRRHDLVKAAALLVAEIERLDRNAIDTAREVGE